MAKGQHLSKHQQKIVNRYYEHRDTISLTKLSELVTELYLSDSATKTEKMWKQVATALKNAGVKPDRIEKLTTERDLEKISHLINELNK